MGADVNDQTGISPGLAPHGAANLPSVVLDSYNLEVKDEEGFVGDRASNKAFRGLLEELRKPHRKNGADPLGDEPSLEISKKKLDKLLANGDLEAAGIVLGTIEKFANELAFVIRRFMKLKGWKDTERIAIGGGLRDSRVGELAIGRAAVMLKEQDHAIDLRPIHYHPDEAGLIGAIHLAPAWMFSGHDGIIAVDIGGTNIRSGVVCTNLKKAQDASQAEVAFFDLWRHRDDKPTREEAVERLIEMLEDLIAKAKKNDIQLAPFIGIGCPGLINDDGTIERGSQNLPGNWASSKFHLPTLLKEAIPKIEGYETAIVLHNDAVVQGLSEVPFMHDVTSWGVLTMGTGLGNARFTNRQKPAKT